MLRLLLILIIANCQPIFAQNQPLSINTSFAFHSNRFLSLQNSLRSSDKGITKLKIRHTLNNSSSQLALNYDGYEKLTFDGSYFQYVKGIATFGIGTINRNWSFSNNTSLILSQNARPIKSIYLKFKNNFGYEWLPSKANWSLELFNGFTEGSLNSGNSMILGTRAILTPVEGLDFELVQTSQWGGKGHNNGISALGSALFFDTNKGSNSNINKMAGFGISYLIPNDIISLRIYGQVIGEDEAGSLPTCLSYLGGFEISNTKIKYPITFGFEVIDTRTNISKNGYCGPNTTYNNNTYKYINYGHTIGSEIDTESRSIGLYGKAKILHNTEIRYSTKLVTINDKNWTKHRLSSNRQSGLINSLRASWSKNNIKFDGNIHYQGFTLDTANIKKNYGIGISSSLMF